MCFIDVFDQTLAEQLYRDRGLFPFVIASTQEITLSNSTRYIFAEHMGTGWMAQPEAWRQPWEDTKLEYNASQKPT